MPPGRPAGHDLHRPQQRRRLPVAFRAEAVTIGHEPLGGNAGQLRQPAQILKRGGEALEISGLQKCAQAEFDAGGFAHGTVPGAAFAQIGGHLVGVGVFLDQLVNGFRGNAVHGFDQVADAVAVDGVTELELRGHLVALGHGHFAHVVAEAGELRALPVVPRRRRAAPGAEFFLNGLFLPETDDHFPVHPHPAPNKAVLAVAVGGLVHVHEIHVNRGPRNVAIILRVQVRHRFAQLLQAVDPHLRRREGVAPGDETDALGRVIGLLAQGR